MISTYSKSFDRVSRNWRAEKVLLDSLPHLDKWWGVEKGKGEPCKQGETAARSGCIPASRNDRTVNIRPDSEGQQNDSPLNARDLMGIPRDQPNIESPENEDRLSHAFVFEPSKPGGRLETPSGFGKPSAARPSTPPPLPAPPAPKTPRLLSALGNLFRGRGGDRSSKPNDTPQRLSKLKSAPVVEVKNLGGDGANVSKLVVLEDGSKGVWKPAIGESPNLRERVRGNYYIREAAAFTVASLVGMEDLVPPTTIRKVNGQIGSIQEFVPDSVQAASTSNRQRYDGDKDLARAAAFDYLIGNSDRHTGNWMVNDKNGNITLIDHGLGFPDGPEDGTFKTINEARNRGLKIPPEFRNLDANKLVSALQQYKTDDVNTKDGLTDEEIGQAVSRLKDLQTSYTIKEAADSGNYLNNYRFWNVVRL